MHAKRKIIRVCSTHFYCTVFCRGAASLRKFL